MGGYISTCCCPDSEDGQEDAYGQPDERTPLINGNGAGHNNANRLEVPVTDYPANSYQGSPRMAPSSPHLAGGAQQQQQHLSPPLATADGGAAHPPVSPAQQRLHQVLNEGAAAIMDCNLEAKGAGANSRDRAAAQGASDDLLASAGAFLANEVSSRAYGGDDAAEGVVAPCDTASQLLAAQNEEEEEEEGGEGESELSD